MTNQDFDLERLAEDLAPFFRGDALQGFGLPALETDYSWKIKEKVVTAVGLNHTGNGYEANAALKQAFHAKWKEPGVDRVKLAELVIKDWGKVRGNSQSHFGEYVHLAESASPDLPLKGVPSYSKLLSIAAPEVFAIYDARVAVSLTAVQTALALERTMAFSLLPGQNKVTGNTDGRGFSRLQKHSRTNLKKAGWIMIQPHRCSRAYCKLLTQIREKLLPNDHSTTSRWFCLPKLKSWPYMLNQALRINAPPRHPRKKLRVKRGPIRRSSKRTSCAQPCAPAQVIFREQESSTHTQRTFETGA